MASRRRRTTATNSEPALEAPSPADRAAFDDWVKTWEDNAIDIARKVGEEAPELTHEEMLEIAEERELANESAEEEKASIEEFLAVAAADTFEALQKAEEEKGLDSFFDPSSYKQEVRLPAPTAERRATPKPTRGRYILRNQDRRRRG